MTIPKHRHLLDYVPFIILLVLAILLIVKVVSREVFFLWQHYVGFIFLLLTGIAFYKRHQLGVLVLGLTLLIGLFGQLSFNLPLTTVTYGLNLGDTQVPFFYGQPLFFVWLIIHFILSGRYYVGIVTKKYWNEFKSHKTL